MTITFEANDFEMAELFEAICKYEENLAKRIEKWESYDSEHAAKYLKILNKRLNDIDNIHTKIAKAELKARETETLK